MAVPSSVYGSRRRGRRGRSKRKGAQLQRGESQWDTDSLSGIITSQTAKPQAKFSVSSPEDASEKQADRMADQVVAGETVSRKCDECEEEEAQTKLMRQPEEEEEAQTKLMRQPEEEEEAAQTKLMRKGEEEEEAQPKLMRMEEEEEAQTKLMRQPEEEEEAAQTKLMRQEEEEEAQTKLMRKGEEEEEAMQMKGDAPASSGTTPSSSPASLSSRLSARKGMGSPLPDSTRRSMEAGFGRDFSGVRIHTDSEAETMSGRLRAQAFTLGKDIYFNRGKFSPTTREGKHLLAHELTHVVQQNRRLNKRVQLRAAGRPCNPCPNPPTHNVRVRVRPVLQFGRLPGGFGSTPWARSRVRFVSVWHRERRNCNFCGPEGKKESWDLCPRSGVVLATVPVIIDSTQIRRRGPNGERWFIDCNNVFDVQHVTPAAAAAAMGRPTRITVGMTRRHELYHVSVSERLLRDRLEARPDISQVCPYNSREIARWKARLETDWRTDSNTFLQGNPSEPNEERNARNHTC